MEEREPLVRELLNTIPQVGEVCWIGVRPARDTAMQPISEVRVNSGTGLEGDRFSSANNKREVTLIQQEHLVVVESIMGKPVDPAWLRRNIVVKGINLLSLKNQVFQIGDVVLKGTGNCYPCSKMERALGAGGYNAMRGHGGLTASVEKSGSIKIGDRVAMVEQA